MDEKQKLKFYTVMWLMSGYIGLLAYGGFGEGYQNLIFQFGGLIGLLMALEWQTGFEGIGYRYIKKARETGK